MTQSVLTKNIDLQKYKNLTFQLLIATIPVVLVGYIFKDLIEQRIFSIESIAISNLIFAAILLYQAHQDQEQQLQQHY